MPTNDDNGQPGTRRPLPGFRRPYQTADASDEGPASRDELIEMITVALLSTCDRKGRKLLVPNAEKHATAIADSMLAGEREVIKRLEF